MNTYKYEREQTTIRLPVDLKEELQRQANDGILSEAIDFVRLLKNLDEKQQEGLYLIIQGAAVLDGAKSNIFE